jgi:3-methyladenine DNA glycosylase AlkD
MKSAMPYYGLAAPTLRAVCKAVFVAHPLPTFAAWAKTATGLWTKARFREERYAAIELTGDRLYRAHQTLEALPMYERFIVEGAWWDYVDVLAIRRVGPLLGAYPREMKKTLTAWSRGDDLWKRRSAIIAQVGFKQTTDPDLLARYIAPSLGRKEFWLRKAIGWALRAYAWHEPDWVVRYVREHGGELSPLSVREALKNVGS